MKNKTLLIAAITFSMGAYAQNPSYNDTTINKNQNNPNYPENNMNRTGNENNLNNPGYPGSNNIDPSINKGHDTYDGHDNLIYPNNGNPTMNSIGSDVNNNPNTGNKNVSGSAKNSKDSTMKQTSGKYSNKSTIDCCKLENGKMMCTKEGKTKPMEKSIRLKNGTVVMTDGTLKSKDGKTTQLKDGECVDMKGDMISPAGYKKTDRTLEK
jgi:hypothetical protein